MSFNITRYKTLTDMFSDSTLQPALKKRAVFKFGYSIKEERAQLSEKAIKIRQHNYVSVQGRFLLHILQPKQAATD